MKRVDGAVEYLQQGSRGPIRWFGTAPRVDSSVEDDDEYYTTAAEQRADLLAFDLWGDPSYGWLIVEFNAILKPYPFLPEGKVLRVPSLARFNRIKGGS